MPRPVALFTGQWADLPLETLCREGARRSATTASSSPAGAITSTSRARSSEQDYVQASTGTCSHDHGLACFAISNHLVGQAVCDRDRRAPQGDPAAARLGRRRSRGRAPARGGGDDRHRRRPRGASSTPRRPPVKERLRAHAAHRRRRLHGQLDLAPRSTRSRRCRRRRSRRASRTSRARWRPILDEFDEAGVSLRARGAPDRDRLRHRDARGARSRRSAATGASASTSIRRTSATRASTTSASCASSATRVFNVHVKDVWWSRRADAESASSAATPTSARDGRFWDFRSPGRGRIDFEGDRPRAQPRRLRRARSRSSGRTR